ncbi:MAG: hypothetical protein KY476_05410 [Planctomycetes bacterium]|nr:hypothetical protein [Planctomycetota bacterium]
MPAIYVETTIASFYFEERSEPEMVARRNWTRQWWDDCRLNYDVGTMTSDPAIDAVREARHRISASVGHDPRKLVEHYLRLQERHRDKLIFKAKKKPKPHDESAA